MGFDVPEQLDPVIIRNEPEESFMLIGLSLLLPYLEPYLIRSMNRARAKISDPGLLADLRRFCAQEGQHFREHKRFNKALRKPYLSGLAALEESLDRDYQRFTATKSLRFNLAYAEGFEALTAATALFLIETRDKREMHPQVEALMFWHSIEELEHRTVAFDVYQQLYGSYLYRLAVGIYAQVHLVSFAIRVTRHIFASSPHNYSRGRTRRLLRQISLVGRKLLPKLVRSYSPRYNPRNIEFTPQMQKIADDFSQRAKAVS